MIRAARPEEIALLPQIENAADERYVRVGLRRVLDMPPASVASLEQGRRHGMLWVATSPLNRVVGFALMKLPAGTAWLDQLSVLGRWQGRGLGAALIDRTAQQARALGYDTLYLSTYLDVPWNAPFYARRGFAPVRRAEWPRAFRMQFMIENSHGHPPWRRTIMQRRV
jgi:GNAT superfamily N-acetyltransferase